MKIALVARNSEPPACLLIALSFFLTSLKHTFTPHERAPTARNRDLAQTIDATLSPERPSMGSASPNATASLSIAQLTLTGPVFPYIASTSGLNKTDASFAALIRRCLGEEGPP